MKISPWAKLIQLDDAIDDRVSHSDQSVERPQREPVHELLEEQFHAHLLVASRTSRRADTPEPGADIVGLPRLTLRPRSLGVEQ